MGGISSPCHTYGHRHRPWLDRFYTRYDAQLAGTHHARSQHHLTTIWPSGRAGMVVLPANVSDPESARVNVPRLSLPNHAPRSSPEGVDNLLHRKIAHAWETFGLVATGRAGGRPRRGTESPIMQLIAYLDHRRQSQQATFITFWDITKAFDSPSKNVLRASLARLAVPPQWAEWFVGVMPKSPSTQEFLRNGHRPSEAPSFDQATDQPGSFRAQRGCSQGDPPMYSEPFTLPHCIILYLTYYPI